MVELVHEKIEVYTAAVALVALADAIGSDELRRSATSIVANIADGAGSDRIGYYRSSLKSAIESSDMCDHADGRAMLEEIGRAHV